ncbi:MAG TPA: hypothetical protein PLQ12_09815 [Candidatus Defluviicoccus seviourii]|nr:hypothetical protein [Candidatus Defluviicoccus seviourii]
MPDRYAPLTADHDQGVRRLWTAVLQHALSDAGSPKPRVRERVARWVGGDDFWHCCELAGFEPRRTAAVFRSVLDTPPRPMRARRGGWRAGTRRRQRRQCAA